MSESSALPTLTLLSHSHKSPGRTYSREMTLPSSDVGKLE